MTPNCTHRVTEGLSILLRMHCNDPSTPWQFSTALANSLIIALVLGMTFTTRHIGLEQLVLAAIAAAYCARDSGSGISSGSGSGTSFEQSKGWRTCTARWNRPTRTVVRWIRRCGLYVQ